MDSPQAVTHVSLCAGYGGIDLGLRRAIPDLRTIAFSEIEAFAVANLVAKMEAGHLDVAPVWPNVKTFPWGKFRGLVDILSGGYPCQPFSAAGRRLGKDDPRHLWPWIADGILAMRPKLCFFENVEGHISLGLEDVLLDLQRIGYRCTFGVFSASEVGAPHQRKRLFILAHLVGARLERLLRHDGEEGRENAGRSAAGCGEDRGGVWPSRPGQPQYEWEPPRVVVNTSSGKRDWQQRRGSRAMGVGNASEDIGPASPNAGCSRASEELANTKRGRGKEPSVQSADISTESGRCDTEAVAHGNRRGREVIGESQSEGEPSASGNVADGRDCADSAVGHAASGTRLRASPGATGHAALADEDRAERQTEPEVGRDADGPAGGMDDAELHVSGDSRVDELRLLGNGVVPATAERAFTVLAGRLLT